MEDILNVGIYQYDIAWENPEANKAKIVAILESNTENIDVLLLPEMFNTGFSMNVQANAEVNDGKTINWMKEQATLYDVVIIGSLIIKENGNYYNRSIVAYPDGMIDSYDKRHLFSYGKEDQSFTAGNKKLIVDVKGWKLCPLICYDLRFPVWSRNNKEYDVLIYMANWPSPRALAWTSLLKARAIENISYVCGVNRVGKDKNELSYQGDSQYIDFEGQIIRDLKEKEGFSVVQLKKEKLINFRSKYKFHQDRDQFKIID